MSSASYTNTRHLVAGTEGMSRLGGNQPEGAGNPLQRWGSVKEIADGTVYLFSDTGSYVNGEVLVVDGGGWRAPASMGGKEMSYPGFLLADLSTKAKL